MILEWALPVAQKKCRHSYDRTVSFFVHEGAAIITFDSGETVDLKAGDFLTIMSGAAATWSITKPIRNSFSYHDSFTSAENRSEQVYGVGMSSKDRSTSVISIHFVSLN